MKRILARFGVDKAVFSVVVSRGFTIASGLVTVLLVGHLFSQELQGFYYAFMSLSAIRGIAELGLGNVIVQFTSHEWANTVVEPDGRLGGDPQAKARLGSIARQAFRIFFLLGLASTVIIFAAGFFLFSGGDDPVAWMAPWIVFCILLIPDFGLNPAWSIVEGRGMVREVYAGRTVQVVASSLFGWTGMLLGLDLWVLPLTLAGSVLSSAGILFRYRAIFRELFSIDSAGSTVWKHEVWPMQWRVAISYLSGYFVFNFFTPVAFHYYGAVVAGQLGMTLNVMSAIQSFSTIWLTAKIPAFGMMVATNDRRRLEREFQRTTGITCAAAICLSVLAAGFVVLLDHHRLPFSARILPITPFLFFTVANLLVVFGSPFSAYVRSHKKEIFVPLSILSGLGVGATVLISGKYYSVLEMSVGYFAITLVVLVLMIHLWRNFRMNGRREVCLNA